MNGGYGSGRAARGAPIVADAKKKGGIAPALRIPNGSDDQGAGVRSSTLESTRPIGTPVWAGSAPEAEKSTVSICNSAVALKFLKSNSTPWPALAALTYT